MALGLHGLNASLGRWHRYGAVAAELLYGLDPAKVGQYEPCVLLGITSLPSRALHFSILCESGAQWARIPLHALRHELPPAGADYPVRHPLDDLQCWDCHGYEFALTHYDYLREMACRFLTADGRWVPASYWLTLDHVENGFSDYPPEHKCYHLLLLEDGSGQIAAQPNNRILWDDKSFVKPGHPLDYRVMAPATWHAEHRPDRRTLNPQATALTQEEEGPYGPA
jgi:hypothetical protein